MAAAGNVATANDAHQLNIKRVAFTEIRVQVDRRHFGFGLQEQDRKVVASTASDDKQMPYSMTPWIPGVEHEENNTAGIEDAARNEPAKARG